MNFYKSRYTGTQIDSLLDKVKEDLVSPATLTNKVEANAAAVEQEVTDREKAASDLNSALTAELDKKVSKVPGKGLSTNDYTNDDKAEVTKIKDKADQTDLNETNSNIRDINTAIEKLVPKEDINTGTFDPTSDNPAGQKSIAGAMEKKQDTLVSGENVKTINGTSLLGSGDYAFDTALNEASTNAVQNKVIAKFANDVAGTYVTKIELYEALKRGEVSSEVEKVYTSEINYIAENVMPSGKVTKILGKTEKSENLLVLDDVAETTLNGITYSVSNGAIAIRGTASQDFAIKFPIRSLILDGTYNISKNVNNRDLQFQLMVVNGNDYNSRIQSEFGQKDGVNTVSNWTRLSLFIYSRKDHVYASGTIIRPMLVKGTTAPTTWSQGYNGLKHTHITGIKTTGINLWDEATKLGYYQSSNGAFVSASNQLCSENPIRVIPNATYYIKKNSITDLRFYDCNMNYISGNQQGSNSSFTAPENACYLHINLRSNYGTTYNHDICINFSNPNINGNYYPYEEETLNVGFKGNGVGTASDEINVEEKKKYQRFGIVDLGDLNWNYDETNQYFNATISNIKPAGSNTNVAKILCSKYESNSWNNTAPISSGVNLNIAVNGSSALIGIRDSSYTNKTTFKQAMVGQKLVYELATPIVTDVEIENDGWLSNLVKDGSITQQVDTDNLIAKEVDIAVNVVVDNQ